MHKRTLFILPVIAGVLCLAFPVVPEQLGTPRLLPDGVNSLLGMVGMTVLCAALNILRRLSAPASPSSLAARLYSWQASPSRRCSLPT